MGNGRQADHSRKILFFGTRHDSQPNVRIPVAPVLCKQTDYEYDQYFRSNSERSDWELQCS